jgi:TorA maturation chaperone TorD
MNADEKENFCRLMVCLLSPPDRDIIPLIGEGTLHALMLECLRSWGGEEKLLDGFVWDSDPGALLKSLEEAYRRLFLEITGECIPMVESCYKPWSRDVTCTLPFASEKGYLMGDPALHLRAVFQGARMTIDEAFTGCPDHLIIELEFLAHLYRGAGESEIQTFIRDHLDWIPLLKDKIRPSRPHPFYISVLEILGLFLKEERGPTE